MIGVAAHTITHHFCINLCTSFLGVLPLLKYENPGPFANHKTIAGFVERTSAAIIILLLFLLLMNGLAIYLRNKFEKTW